MSNLVVDWFGDSYVQLDPMLQRLHRSGGVLIGQVDLIYADGPAGIVGRRIAKKLGLPQSAGQYEFRVEISHQEAALHWARQFDSTAEMVSVFMPHGNYPSGYWSETTGNLSLHLGVHISDGGWHWVQRKLIYRGVTLPLWLLPSTKAYKQITNGKYEFSVGIFLPVFGELFGYSGLLDTE